MARQAQRQRTRLACCSSAAECRDTRSIQLKLDEILRTSEGARGELVKLELLSDQQLSEVEAEITRLRRAR